MVAIESSKCYLIFLGSLKGSKIKVVMESGGEAGDTSDVICLGESFEQNAVASRSI